MKKVLLLLVFGFASAVTTMAQAPVGKGGAQFNAGLGFSSFGTPVYLGADFGVHRDFTVGPIFSYRNYGYRGYDQSLVVLGVNGNYHFNNLLDIPSEWNFYAGLTLGYYVWGNNDFPGAKDSDIGFTGQIGGRYFFTNKFGVNLEFGGGTASGGSLGITYKFR